MRSSFETRISRYLGERRKGRWRIPLDPILSRVENHRLTALSISATAHSSEASLSLVLWGETVSTKLCKRAGDFIWNVEFPPSVQILYLVDLELECAGELSVGVLSASFADAEPTSTGRRLNLPVYRDVIGIEDVTNRETFRLAPREGLLTHVRLHAHAAKRRECAITVGGTTYVREISPSLGIQSIRLRRPLRLSTVGDIRLRSLETVTVERLGFDVVRSSTGRSRPAPAETRRETRIARQLFSRSYDESLPIYFLHVPKCGGISSKSVLREWFPNRFYGHYFLPDKGAPLPVRAAGQCAVGGHFSRSEGTGLEAYYPDARQKVTILRDPYDIAVSRYFYLKTRPVDRAGRPFGRSLKLELERSLAEKDDLYFNFLPLRPPRQDIEAFLRNEFLYVGLSDCLADSLQCLALLLGKELPLFPALNGSRPSEALPDLRGEFRNVFKEEYELFDLVREKHVSAGFRRA